MVDGEMRSFAECGGTSVGAVLMIEDLRQTFGLYNHSDTDQLPLLLDKILHSSLTDVVQYISSQLGSSANFRGRDQNENALTL